MKRRTSISKTGRTTIRAFFKWTPWILSFDWTPKISWGCSQSSLVKEFFPYLFREGERISSLLISIYLLLVSLRKTSDCQLDCGLRLIELDPAITLISIKDVKEYGTHLLKIQVWYQVFYDWTLEMVILSLPPLGTELSSPDPRDRD